MPRPAIAIVSLLPLVACGDDVADGNLSIDMQLEAVSPAQAPLAGGVEITLAGANFPEGVTLTVGGEAPLSLTRHSEHRLTFIAPPLDAGLKDLVLHSPAGRTASLPGALRYSAVILALRSTNLLSPVLNQGVLTGDLDGDGFDDVVGTSFENQLVSLLGRHEGQRLEAVGAPIAEHGGVVALRDVNGDGQIDLIGKTGVNLASAPGRFDTFVDWTDGQRQLVWVALIADFDGDGEEEIARQVQDEGSHRRYFAIGEIGADGALLDERELEDVRLGITRFEATAADVNADGISDLAYVDTEGAVRVLLGPDFELETGWQSETTAPNAAWDIIIFDANDDGVLDLVGSQGANTVRVYLGDGEGGFSFEEAVTQPCWPSPLVGWELLPARASQSQKLLATCGNHREARLWFYQPGGIHFLPSLRPEGARGYAVAHLDGDNFADLVAVTDRGLEGWYGNSQAFSNVGGPTLARRDDHPRGAFEPAAVVTGVFGEGKTLAAAFKSRVGVAHWAEGELLWAEQVELPLEEGASVEALAACSDAEGGSDALLAQIETEDQVQIVLSGPEGLRLGPIIEGDGTRACGNCQRIFTGDLDGDGRCDLVRMRLTGDPNCLSLQTCETQLLSYSDVLGDPGASATSHVIPLGLGGFLTAQPRVADVDADGREELYHLVYGDEGELQVEVLGLDDSGGWTASSLKVELGNDERGERLRLRDLLVGVPGQDPAGGWALATAGGWSYTVPMRRNEGGFEVAGQKSRYAADEDFKTLRRADLDGDGIQELIAHALDSVAISKPNPGDGVAPTATVLSIPTGATHALWHDYDGDGLIDLVLTGQFTPGRLGLVHNESR